MYIFNKSLFVIILIFFSACSSQHIDDGTTSAKSYSASKINSDDGINKAKSGSINTDDGSNNRQYKLVYSSKPIEKSPDKKLTYKKPESMKAEPINPVKESSTPKIEKVEIDHSTPVKKSESIKPLEKMAVKEPRPTPVVKAKPDRKEPNEDSPALNVPKKDVFYYPVSDFSIITPFSAANNNNGIELKIKEKTSIKTAAPGFVIFAGKKSGLDGNLIVIFHNENFLTIYSNLTEIRVKKGDYIKEVDTVIATASESLYFELRRKTDKGTIPVDPKTVLERRK